MDIERAKHWFIETALSYLGTPYVWGGDDPSGFDCSGFVNECLKTVGLIAEREDFTAAGIVERFRSDVLQEPERAALACWLNAAGAVHHVGICLDKYFCIAASGGSAVTVDSAAAWRQNAYVRIRPIRYRPERVTILDPFKRLRDGSG
ncbi:MAG: NlpC/P60 family protein [bacterium]